MEVKELQKKWGRPGMGTFIMQQGHKVDIGGGVANYTNVCVLNARVSF